MKDKIIWLRFWITNSLKRKFYQVRNLLFHMPFGGHCRKQIGNKFLLNCDRTQNKIAETIRDGKPMMVCRFGNNELQMVVSSLEHRMFPKIDHRQRALNAMCGIAGFFPNQIEEGQKFADLMLDYLKEVDILAWWNIFMQDYVITSYLKDADICTFSDIFPWSEDLNTCPPWSKELRGKRVLLIHPFDQSITEQYTSHRGDIFNKICETDDILPEFHLITLRALQTMGGENTYGYKSWFEALQFMIDECKKIDFDVAIIGCGAYGFPLAAEIKRMGKVAIHLGGATQLMFGILGARWMKDSAFMERVVNDSWVHPKPEETPQNNKRYENGCYW